MKDPKQPLLVTIQCSMLQRHFCFHYNKRLFTGDSLYSIAKEYRRYVNKNMFNAYSVLRDASNTCIALRYASFWISISS